MPQYDTSTITAPEIVTSTAKSFSMGEVWIIISILLAIIGGIFIFTNYFGKDKEDSYTGFKKTMYDFLHFKLTIIEPIFRVLYFIVAIAITLSSFSFISVNFFTFIGILVFGNIAARLAFELLLLTLRLFKDVSEINVKLGKTEKASKVKKDKKNEKEAEEK